MSKAVLISINPKWCALIANGKKTIEVRKTRPKIETPFKCYIYCTNSGRPLVLGEVFRGDWHTEYTQTYGCSRKEAEKTWEVYNGKVIGELVCDEIMSGRNLGEGEFSLPWGEDEDCLSDTEIEAYGKNASNLYGWHISDLVIYDKPKELSDFVGLRETRFGYAPVKITRPPQSWCYVREIE